jgi:iron complex outermembrane receptor protein
MLSLRSRTKLVTVLFAVSTSPLLAQVSPPLEPGPAEIAPVEVRGERTSTVIGGAAALVVRPDSSRAGVALSLAELMRTVPQVLVRTNSRGEVEFSVRGSDSRQMSVMLNGLPLSPSWDGRADPSLVPLSGVNEITYVRSTGSLLGGPNAIGGVMDLRIGAPEGMSSRSLSLGSDETGAKLLSLAWGTRVGEVAGGQGYLRAGAGHRSRDGLIRAADVPDFDPDARLRTNTDLRQSDAFVAAGWEGQLGAAINALVSGYTAERGVAPESHNASPRNWRYPDHARALVQLQGVAPAFDTRFGKTRVSGSVGALDARIRIESFSDPTYATVSGTEAGDERVTSGRVAIMQTTPRGAEWRGALTVNDVQYDEKIDADPTSRYRQRLSSAGVERHWSLGERNLMTAGVVLDQAATLESGGKTANPDRSLVGWRLGATRTLSSSTRTHASVSRRARFPALRELYSGALNRFEPNPALRPEQLLAAEAGATWGSVDGRGIRSQVVAFHHWLDDAVVRVPFDTTNRFIRINRDELRSFGLETSFGWRGAALSTIDLDLLVQRVRIRDAAADADARRPEHMPGMRAVLSGARGVGRGVVLGASVAHIGSQYCVDPGGPGSLSLDAQSVAGMTAERSWALGRSTFRRLRVLLGADNLTDAAVYEQCGLPRAGRTLRIGITLD